MNIKILIVQALAVFNFSSVLAVETISMKKTPNQRNSDALPITGANTFFLPSETLLSAKNKALENKDKDLAFQIYQHYQLGVFDQTNSAKWLEIASSYGHPVAKYNLAMFLLKETDNPCIPKDIERAKTLLRELASQGNKSAAKHLNELDAK